MEDFKGFVSGGSQLQQDLFAYRTVKNKTYVEIGASGPIKYNNTYQLEKRGWKGFSIEFNANRVSQWDGHPERKNKANAKQWTGLNRHAARRKKPVDVRVLRSSLRSHAPSAARKKTASITPATTKKRES